MSGTEDLLTLVFTELTQAIEQTKLPVDGVEILDPAFDRALLPQEQIKLQISDLDLDLPVHLAFAPDSFSHPAHLMITLPSTLESSGSTRPGRIRIAIQSQ